MIQLKQLITEQTAATKYCKQDVLSKPQFSADKWSAIGIWSKRNIAGTNTPSQHSYGNAIDWHGKQGKLDPVMQELADYLVANANKYNIANVIYNHQIWSSPGSWRSYGGRHKHEDHVHVDFKYNKKNFNNQLYNEKVQKFLWKIYNITTKYPQNYFKQFKGSPWIYGDDKPNEAAKHLNDLYNLYWSEQIDPLIDKLDLQDIKNVENIQQSVNKIKTLIKNGESGIVPFKFYKWDSAKQRYNKIDIKYNWSYM